MVCACDCRLALWSYSQQYTFPVESTGSNKDPMGLFYILTLLVLASLRPRSWYFSKAFSVFKMVYFLLILCVNFLTLSLKVGMVQNTSSVPIGVVLDMGTLLGKMSQTAILMAIEDFYAVHRNYTTRLVIHSMDSEQDAASAAWAALELMRNVQVRAILGPLTSTQAELMADFGSKAQVPIISFSATSSSLSPAEKPYFIRMALDDASQVDAISSIINNFGLKEVVPVFVDTNHGAALLTYLVDRLHTTGIRVPYRSLIFPSASDEHIEKEPHKLMNMQVSVFIVHTPPSLGSRLFLKARDVGLMGNGYIWIMTDSLANFLDFLDPAVVHSMQGVLGVRPYIPKTDELDNIKARLKVKFHKENPGIKLVNVNIFGLWAYDAVWALARAVEKVGAGAQILDNSTTKFCEQLRDAISNVKFSGRSGEIHMVGGQLKSSSFQIINVAGKKGRNIGVWSPAHGISSRSLITNNQTYLAPMMDQMKIFWPEHARSASRGWEILASGKKLIIAVPMNSGFKEMVNVEYDSVSNATLVSGYCIDVFDTVMKMALPYTVDYKYLPISGIERWTSWTYDDLINDVFFQRYDAVVGDITILANRSFFVDFTLPYTETGVWMIVRTRRDGNKNGWVFVKPLKVDLFMGSLAFFCFTGFVVWAIEQRINLEFRGSPREQFGTIFYFTFSTLVFAHKERLQSNLSRFVVIVWVFVVLILTSSYTASLTSILTVEQLQPPSLTDLIKNGDYVGYLGGSFVRDILKQLNFDESKLRSYDTPDEYEDALSRGSHNGGVAAIFDEMPYIRVFLAERCSEYSMFGPIINTKGFGFVFPRGSTLVSDISRAILNATEKGMFIPVERKWFGDQTTCSRPNSAISSNTLTFDSFSGLFVISGTVSAMALLVFIGQYVNKHWDELRTMSAGSPLRRRIVAWARHYSQMDPDILRNGPTVHGCHGTGTAAMEVVDSKPVFGSPGIHLVCQSSPEEPGYTEGRPTTSTELDNSSPELKGGSSSIELTDVNG